MSIRRRGRPPIRHSVASGGFCNQAGHLRRSPLVGPARTKSRTPPEARGLGRSECYAATCCIAESVCPAGERPIPAMPRGWPRPSASNSIFLATPALGSRLQATIRISHADRRLSCRVYLWRAVWQEPWIPSPVDSAAPPPKAGGTPHGPAPVPQNSTRRNSDGP